MTFPRTLAARAMCALLLAFATAQAPAPSPTPTPQPAASALPTAAVPVFTKTLANGLRVVVVEDHAAPVVQSAVWYRFGSNDESAGKTGLAHGLEHMMFRGTHTISGGGIDEIGARLGAQINANTAEDYTHFYLVVPADRLELALRVEADRMRGLLLRQSDWAVEKGAVLGEFDGDMSQPTFRLTTAVRAAAYRGSPYARTALGVRGDIVRSTAADLRAYYDRWYHPGAATLVVTGDVHAADVFARAARWFGTIPGVSVPQPSPLPSLAPPPAPAAITQTADYPYTVVDLVYRIPGDLDHGAAATQVFAQLVNNERSAFYDALVRSKLTLGYQASADTALHAGTLQVLLFVTPGRPAADARRAFERTLAATLESGVDPDLFAAAKTSAARQALYARDSIAGLGDRFGYAYGVEGHDPSVDDEAVAQLDVAAENTAISTYFRAPAAVGVLTPRAQTPAGGTGNSSGGAVSDNFSNRAPSGPIVLPVWAKRAIEAPVTIQSQVDPSEMMLSNGIRLLVQPVRANPTVFINGSIRLWPEFEPAGKAGLAGLTSALLGYGSAKYDFTAQRRTVDELGADVSFGATFSAHGLATDMDKLLDVLADSVKHPALPQQYVDLLRTQEISAVSQRDHNPDAVADFAFNTALYAKGDPALRRETTASLGSISRVDLQAFARRAFRPDLTTIVVAGDVDPADVRARIERAFGDWHAAGAKPRHIVPPLPPAHAVVRKIPAQRDAVTVRLGQPAIGRTNPDFYAFNVLNAVVGGGGTFDTRLMHEIRERRGLVYGVSSALLVTRERGSFEVQMTAAPAKVGPAVRVAKEQLRLVTHQSIPPAELARARSKLIASVLVGEESTATIVAQVENIGLNVLPADYYRTFQRRYGGVTPADALRVAQKYLRPDRLIEVFEGPVATLPGPTVVGKSAHRSRVRAPRRTRAPTPRR